MKTIIVIIGLLVTISLSAQKIGFTHYDTPVSAGTLEELIDALDGSQKSAIMNGYVNRVSPTELEHQIFVTAKAIRSLYNVINAIERNSIEIMKANNIGSQQELTDSIIARAPDYFTNGQITVVVNRMIQYSKRDGSGDWVFYSNAIKNLE